MWSEGDRLQSVSAMHAWYTRPYIRGPGLSPAALYIVHLMYKTISRPTEFLTII